MKRVLRFRAKSINHNKWIYAQLHGFGMDVFSESVKEDTICQFTGLYDCEGKEIYEGDILNIIEYKNVGLRYFGYDDIDAFALEEIKGEMLEKWSGIVQYIDSCMIVGEMYLDNLFGDMRHSQPIFEFKVIGNIYDNKELIRDLRYE